MNSNVRTGAIVAACLLAAGAVAMRQHSPNAPDHPLPGGPPKGGTTVNLPTAAPTHTLLPVPSIPPCANEDGSGGPLPCRWNAKTMGNGVGLSYTIDATGHTHYDPGTKDPAGTGAPMWMWSGDVDADGPAAAAIHDAYEHAIKHGVAKWHRVGHEEADADAEGGTPGADKRVWERCFAITLDTTAYETVCPDGLVEVRA